MSDPVDTVVIRSALVLEDQPDTRAWLVRVLHGAFPEIVVSEAQNVAEAKTIIAKQLVDLALLDLDLPDGSGISVIEELGRRSPHTRCVVATIYDDDDHVFPALRAGASGYLLKEQPQDVLVSMLKRLVGGEPPISPAIARRMLRFFTPPVAPMAAATTPPSDDEHLSPREEEVLQLIAKGYKLAEVGELLKVSRNTAAGYLKSVYRKLNITSRAEATLAAARRGLVESNH